MCFHVQSALAAEVRKDYAQIGAASLTIFVQDLGLIAKIWNDTVTILCAFRAVYSMIYISRISLYACSAFCMQLWVHSMLDLVYMLAAYAFVWVVYTGAAYIALNIVLNWNGVLLW